MPAEHYSHTWRRKRALPSHRFDRIAVDFIRLIPALELAGVPLCGEAGAGQPLLSSGAIAFNGPVGCGHELRPGLEDSLPLSNARGIGIHDAPSGPLPCRCCAGSCAAEPFGFPAVISSHYAGDFDSIEQSCTTRFRPYDLAVTAALIVAKHHLGPELNVCTGGMDAQWADARQLCHSVLRYGGEFAVVDHILTRQL